MELQDIKNRLSLSIINSGKSIIHLSKALNIPLSEIQSYINKTALPPLDIFAKLCILLDVNSNYLLCLDLISSQEKIDMLLYAKADAQNN